MKRGGVRTGAVGPMTSPLRSALALSILALAGCESTPNAVGTSTGGAAGAGGVPSGGRGAAGAGSLADGGSGGSATGAASAGGGGNTTGTAGAAGSVACTIAAQSSLSTAIPTVAIITWSTDLAGISSAEIQFGLADGAGATMVAPVDLTQPSYRTLLLGMKANRTYAFQIAARASSGTCTSSSYMLTTGPAPTGVPSLTVTMANPAAHDRGFIVTTTASNGLMPNIAYIVDADGDPVWWAAAPASPSRAHLSWSGNDMWIEALNVTNNGGEMRRISMDGSTVEMNVAGLASAHHDFTPIPGDGVAAMLWTGSVTNAPNELVERASDGTITTIVADFSALYNSATYFHPNAIHYYPSDDTYTISDRDPSLFVKITRTGQLIWQFGGTNPKDPTRYFTIADGTTWQVNHGHQLLANGHFLFFNNGPQGTPSIALEYALDTATWTASTVWSYQSGSLASTVLGDTERLPNGNTLVTFSTAGQIHEVDPAGNVVMTIASTGSTFGYADFRESLYGQPPR